MITQEIKPLQPAFVAVMSKSNPGRYEIGLAHAGVKGYTPGFGELPYGTSYEDACIHVDELNEFKYGLTAKEAMLIQASTMF